MIKTIKKGLVSSLFIGIAFVPAVVFAQSVSFSATPTSGSAPLTVSFNASGLTSVGGYIVSFGDGTSGSLLVSAPPCYFNSNCSLVGSVSHTYQSAGTYTATLTSGACTNSTNPCTAPSYGSVTITVSGQTSTTFSATPTSGAAPLVVTFTGSVPGTSYTLNFGDGSQPVNGVENVECVQWVTNCAQNATIAVNQTHTYQAAGTYTATLTSGACTNSTNPCTAPSYGSVTITVSGGTQGVSFTATPTSGSAPLSVSFSAFGLSSASGYIIFGDGTSGSLFMNPATCASGTTCTYGGTASHTYQSAGTYTAQLLNQYPQTVTCPSSNPNCNVLATQTITVSGGSTVSPLGATPTSGNAPLSVNFWYPTSNTSGLYIINYGDGTSDVPTVGCAINPLSGTNACPQGLVSSHTYQSAGTYTATLSRGGLPLCASCTAPVLGSVTITVSGGSTQQTGICPPGYTNRGGLCYQNTNITSYQGGGYGQMTAGSCPTIPSSLSRGMRDGTANGPVLQLQTFLAGIFNINPSSIETGYFGPLTQRYVQQFQSQSGVSAVGIVGPLTRAAIARACGQ